MFRTHGNLSKIITEVYRRPFSQHSLKDSPLLLCHFDCNAWDTWQSYQAELWTAELIGEIYLSFILASGIKFFLLDCNGGGPTFIHLLATHSYLVPKISIEFAKRSVCFFHKIRDTFFIFKKILLTWTNWVCQLSPTWYYIDCSQIMFQFDCYQLPLVYPTWSILQWEISNTKLRKLFLARSLCTNIFFLFFAFQFFNFNILLLFNYTCVPLLAIPPPHPSWTPIPPPPAPSPLILSMCPL